jgi:hypothetical protein
VALLKQVKGVGTLIALTFLLTLEDAHRFRKSRDVGCYLGLQPGRRNSGQSQPQMHISKEGDPYLRTLLVQGAQHILGPFGVDCDLRRWGLRLAERGGRNGRADCFRRDSACEIRGRKLARSTVRWQDCPVVAVPICDIQSGFMRKLRVFATRRAFAPQVFH